VLKKVGEKNLERQGIDPIKSFVRMSIPFSGPEIVCQHGFPIFRIERDIRSKALHCDLLKNGYLKNKLRIGK
jgi:hypothetical protein